jgi:hypothetical protein
MNLSQVTIELTPEPEADNKPRLRAEEGRLVKIIEAIQGISSRPEWSTLKTEVFDNLPTILEKDLKEEAKKDNPDPMKLNRLAGQLKWAEKYSDLTKLESTYKVELQRVRIQLYGKTE